MNNYSEFEFSLCDEEEAQQLIEDWFDETLSYDDNSDEPLLGDNSLFESFNAYCKEKEVDTGYRSTKLSVEKFARILDVLAACKFGICFSSPVAS